MEMVIESCPRWFRHVWRIPIKTLVRRVDQMEGNPIVRGRGMPKKTWAKTLGSI